MVGMQKRRLPLQQRSRRVRDRMWSSLSSDLLPSHKLQCFSVACLDMPHLEFGDKIVLPPIRAAGVDAQATGGTLDKVNQQYCSVQEFSAPEGQVFLPYWLMQNLHMPEGGLVVVTSVTNIPRGVYCRLQPETTSFLDLAADIGPKLLMETALRRYSVLSVNSTILIEHGNVRYYVRVAELRPAPVISLCGDIDLETDFMPPEGLNPKRRSSGRSTRLREIRTAEPPATSASTLTVEDTNSCEDSSTVCGILPSEENNGAIAASYGRRLHDGGYVETPQGKVSGSNTTENAGVPRFAWHTNGLRQAQQIVRDRQSKAVSTKAIATASASSSCVLASQLRLAQGSFSEPGRTLGTLEQPHSLTNVAQAVDVKEDCGAEPDIDFKREIHASLSDQDVLTIGLKCELCLKDISAANMELHALRCAKNPTYHKFECSLCHDKLFRAQEYQHHHCPDCAIICESTESLTRHKDEEHSVSWQCTYCGVLFTRSELHDHVENHRCEHALMPCSLCGLSFKNKDMPHHLRMCSSRTERCDVCKTYVNITEFDAHQAECRASTTAIERCSTKKIARPTENTTHRTTKHSNQNFIECVYCSHGGFLDIPAVEHHVTHECRIAKAFTLPDSLELASNNQDDAAQPECAQANLSKEQHDNLFTRPLLAQGRIRRRDDATALHRVSSSRSRSPSSPPDSVNLIPDNGPISFLLPKRNLLGGKTVALSKSRFLQSNLKGLKLRKPKPKPSPQLDPLPRRPRNRVIEIATPRASSISSIRSDGPDLCISSNGGTLIRPLRSRTNRQTRRRPTGPKRLDTIH